MIKKFILFQPDKIIFKPFKIWLIDLKNILNNCDFNNKDRINNLAIATNQISLIYFILNDYQKSEEICNFGFNYFKKKFIEENCQESLNLFLQPLINIIRIKRLTNQKNLQRKYIKKIIPNYVSINNKNIYNILNINSKNVLEINFLLEYSRYLIEKNPKTLYNIINRYGDFYFKKYQNEINEIKILCLMQFDINSSFIYACECYKKTNNIFKYYYLLRILQCQELLKNFEIVNSLLDLMNDELTKIMPLIKENFINHFDLFYNFSLISHKKNKKYKIVKLFYECSIKCNDEHAELIFSKFINIKDKIRKIENESIYSKNSNKKNYLLELDSVFYKYDELMRK
ncbi:hypothetical protein [Silvanigrella sp.]|jgi:hypothetical protein|uniref:hypothetical protein n=1 Tax=Silvanigrella sp. TaxID=2024976 RepID=UPI0037C74654